MSEIFVTQVASEDPRVLVIGEGALVDLVSHVVAEAGLEAQAIKPEPKLVAEAVATNSWYKILWLVDTCQAPATTPELLKSLSQRATPALVVLLAAPTLISAEATQWPIWQAASATARNLISQIEAVLPKATVILIRDWFELSSIRHVVAGWGQFATAAFIADPQVELHPIERDSIQRFLSEVLFRPGGPNRLVFQGSSLASFQLCQSLQSTYHRLYGQTLTIKSRPVVQLEPSESYSIRQVSGGVDSSALVRDLVKLWPSPNAPKPPAPVTSTTALPVPVTKSVKVPPMVPPTVQKRRAPSRLKSPQTPVVPQPVVKPEAELEDAVASLFSSYRTDHRRTQTAKMVKDTRSISKRSQRRKKVFFAGLAGGAVALVTTAMIGSYVLAGWLVSHNLDEVLITANAKPNWYPVLRPVTWWMKWQTGVLAAATPPGFAAQSRIISEVVFGAGQLEPQIDTWQAQQQRIVGKLLGAKTESPSSVVVSADRLYQELSQLQAALKELSPEWLTEPNQQAVEAYRKWLESQRQTLVGYQQLQPWLSTYLGQSSKRTYAVVIQNEQELRPTGGFVQAVALLTVESGVITDVQVMSSYDLDSKVSGTVQPPAAIVAYLGEKKLFFRDSNWDPDFPTAANQMAWFIEQATTKKIDGVMAMTVGGWQQLIKATGPIELPGFNETITDRNLAERLEFHSEIQFSQVNDKPDYTTTLLKTFLGQLPELTSEKQSLLMQAFAAQLKNQGILITMLANAENQPLASLGWTGSLITPDCPSKLATGNCLTDSLAQVEANVGINKANYYLDEKVVHQIQIGDQKVHHRRAITLKNQAQTNAWPKGSYRTYLRWYVPADSQFLGIQVNGSPLLASAVTTSTEHGKTVWGAVVEVPIQSQAEVVLEYQRPLPYSQNFAYSFIDQKQPGTDATQNRVELGYAKGLIPEVVAPQATLKTQQIVFESAASGHQVVGVQFK